MYLNKHIKYIYKWILLISCISSIILFLSFLHPTFNIDEEYTMGLIQHSYKNIFYINMGDVHPPTYYILLKLFLNITTFWTTNLYIKIFFGHILSLIVFILSFILLCKIINSTHLYINYWFQLIGYLLFYSISLYSVDLRMHGFSAFLNILVYYELVKLNKFKSINLHILFIIIYSVMAAYMDYFSAVCVGSLIFICCVDSFIHHNKLIGIKLFISDCILLLLSIPLMKIMGKQVITRNAVLTIHPSSFINILDICDSFTQSKMGIIMMIPLIIVIIWAIRHLNDEFDHVLIISLMSYVFALNIAMIAYTQVKFFEPKFFYPLFSIYSFLIIAVISHMIRYYHYNLYNINKIILIVICMIPAMSIAKSYMNIKQYTIPSYYLICKMNHLKSSKYHNVYMNYDSIPSYVSSSPKQVYITQISVYLKSIHKRIIINNCTPQKASSIVSGNSKLLEETFNNLRFNSK